MVIKEAKVIAAKPKVSEYAHNEKLDGIDRIIKKLLLSNDHKLLEKIAY